MAAFPRATKGHSRFCQSCGHVIPPADLRIGDTAANTYLHPACYARTEGILPQSIIGFGALTDEEKAGLAAAYKDLPHPPLTGSPEEVSAAKLAIRAAWKAAQPAAGGGGGGGAAKLKKTNKKAEEGEEGRGKE